MKKTFKLINEAVRTNACEFIYGLSFDEIHEVSIAPYEETRKLVQNSLMWVFITAIAEHQGNTKLDVHNYYKKTYLLPIYERDDIEYAKAVNAVRELHKKGFVEDAKSIASQIINLTSTTRATVKQMTEYIKDIERDAISKGIPLPAKDERYNTAMGFKED